MRETSIASLQLTLDDPPADPAQLQRHLREQNTKIMAAFSALAAGHLDRQHVAPAKPRDGDWRYADGTNWNPGAGKGFYRFDGDTNAWVFLG